MNIDVLERPRFLHLIVTKLSDLCTENVFVSRHLDRQDIAKDGGEKLDALVRRAEPDSLTASDRLSEYACRA